MRELTTVCRDGKVVKKGWSDATFDRRLTEFKERYPNLKGGRWQNDPYSLGPQPGGVVVEFKRELGEAASDHTQNHNHHSPPKGCECDDGGFFEPSSTLKPPSEGSEGGSSQSRAKGVPVVENEDLTPEDEVARKVREQLRLDPEPVVKSSEEKRSDGGGPRGAG
jgi:hypothetical protein